MVTDHIERFAEHGILLKSGEFLDADIIVTATGLELQMLGGMRVEVDGQPMDLSACYTYKGLMLSDVPNLIITFGYLNASWTLRLDLTAEFTCRLMRYMEHGQFVQCVPRVSQDELRKPARPFIEGFSSNYLQRALDRMPKQGSGPPWVNPQDYYLDVKLIKRGRFDDGALEFRQGTEDVPKPLSGVDTAGVQAEKVGPVSKTINN